MHICHEEIQALVAGAGVMAGVSLWLKLRWNQVTRWINLRLLAMHLHRCGASCSCMRYTKVVAG